MTSIRPYEPGDYDAVSRVCLLTADGGGDATGLYGDDRLMPDIWARPYLEFEPEWAWVVDDGSGAGGYILGVPDTRAFVARYRADWVPRLAARYEHVEPAESADEKMRRLGFVPERMLIDEIEDYPAHLHIDLLPHLQGRGLGRALVATLETALAAAQVPGVHLGVDPANTGALAFYRRLGFTELPSSSPDEPLFARRIPPAAPASAG